jgi:biotin carboxyl carrier protein
VTFEVETNGRLRRVSVEHRNGRFVVEVDGRKCATDVSQIGQSWSLIIEEGGIGHGMRRSYEISISEHPESGFLAVHVDGRPVTVSLGAGRGAFSPRARGAIGAAGKGPQRVAAPMPGKVVKLLVKPGDSVAPQQGLVVVEAMKMENELRSPKAGTVIEVCATEGASVDAGAVLVIVE